LGIEEVVAGGRERVSENIIAYFAQKVCWKVCFFKKKRQIRQECTVGANGNIGKNDNFLVDD